MGLDVTAYNNISPIDNEIDENGDVIGDIDYPYFVSYLNKIYQARCEGMTHEKPYRYDDEISLHAGSYSRYNEWRNQLAKFAGYPTIDIERYGQIVTRYDEYVWRQESGDFWELIWFSDCESILGTATCKKLYNDFKLYLPKLDEFVCDYPVQNDWFKQKYLEWLELFKFASENGCVYFH